MRIEGEVDVTALLRSGVYLLLWRGAVVYVGKGKVMLARVYTHRSNWGRRVTEKQPRGIAFDQVKVIPAALDLVDELERELIERFRPRYNTQYNNGLPPDIEVLVAALVPQAAAPPVAMPRIHRRF